MYGSALSLKLKGSFALLGSSFTIALFGLLVQWLQPMFGTVTQTAIRSAIAALIMGAAFLFVIKRPLKPLSQKDWLKTAVLGVGGSITLILFTIAAGEGKIASATFLLFAGNIATAVIGGLVLFKERLTVTRILALALALGGIYLYVGSSSSLGIVVFAGLAAGVSDGLANIVRKRMRHIDRPTALLYQYAIGAVVAAGFVAAFKEQPILEVNLVAIVVMVVFAALALNLGNLLLYGYGHVDVQTGAVLSSMQVFFAVALGLIFLRQVPEAHEIIGCVSVCLAAVLAVLGERQKVASVKTQEQTA